MSLWVALLAMSSVGVEVAAPSTVPESRVAILERRLIEGLSARGWGAIPSRSSAPCSSDGATCATALRASAGVSDALFVRLTPGLSRAQLTLTRATASDPSRRFDLVVSSLDALADTSLDPALDALGFVAVVAPEAPLAPEPADPVARGLSTTSHVLAGAGVVSALVGGVFAVRAIDESHELASSVFADPDAFAADRDRRDVSVAVACAALAVGIGLLAVALIDPW